MQQLFSNLSKINPFSRKQIFSQYKLPEDPSKGQTSVLISKDKKEHDQILMRQIRLFKVNLQGVLNEKTNLIHKLDQFKSRIGNVNEFLASFNQGEKDQSEQIKHRWMDVCKQEEAHVVMNHMTDKIQETLSRGHSVQPAYLLKAMILYKVMLNVGKQIKYEAESFRLGTMSNFSKSTTQPKFTKKPEQAEKSVHSYLKKISVQSSKFMQSKIRNLHDWEKQRFLLEDDLYSACRENLEQLYSPKQVELVHFDMLNVLNEFDEKMQQFEGMLYGHEIKYKKYEGMMNSIQLMDRQMKEMKQIIHGKDDLLRKLAGEMVGKGQQYNPGQLQKMIEKQKDQETVIHKNIKIYHINQKVFANYNTETNLIFYYQLRKNYSLYLTQLQTRMEQWKGELSVIQEISTNYSRVDDLLNRKAAALSGEKHQKKFLTLSGVSDSELVRLVVGLQEVNAKRNPQLNSFKKSVVQKVKDRIGGDQVGNIRLSSGSYYKSNESNGKDTQILQAQKSFFLGLLLTPNHIKKSHLIQKANHIEQYIVFDTNILNDRNVDQERIKRYLWQFQVLQQILIATRNLKSIQSGQTPSQEFPQIIERHLQIMQKKMKTSQRQEGAQIHELLCNHIYDYEKFSQLFSSQTWKEYLILLDDASQKDVARSFTFSSDSSNKKNLKELIVFTQKVISLNYLKPLQNIIHIFYESLFQINQQVSFELFAFQHYFWQTFILSFVRMYARTGFFFTQNMKSLSSLDPEEFFSIPCLTELTRSKIKVKNIEEIILKIMKKLYNKVGDFHEDKLVQNIVCLTYFIYYLRDAYDPEDRKDMFIVLARLRRSLAVELMKMKYGKMYATSIMGTSSLSPRQVCMILGLEKYLTSKDPSEKLNSKLQFSQNCQRYLSMFQKQIKPLTINISSSFSSQRTMTKIQNLQSFEEWFDKLQQIIQDKKLSPLYFFAFFNVLQQNLQELLKLVNSSQVATMKESEGFLIKMIKRENFYLKKQINKFKLLAKEGIWERFDKVIVDALNQLNQYNNINDRRSKIEQLDNLKIKVKKILLNAQKKYL